jgi:4a-hydroxytetrahydrobiopterin dehydratase
VPYAPLASEQEIISGLARLPDWKRDGDTITRTVRCRSFRAAIDLVVHVADAAEAADHHPATLVDWRRVTFTLTTHASRGLTAKDFALASEIDRLAEAAATDPASSSPSAGSS